MKELKKIVTNGVTIDIDIDIDIIDIIFISEDETLL